MKNFSLIRLFLFFISVSHYSFLYTDQNFKTIAAKAIRPESPVLGSVNFPASCGDCCNDESGEDCRLSDIESLLEVIQEEIVLLTELTEFCCGDSTSSFGPFLSTISALAAFDQTCCAQTNSNINALLEFDQTCCSNTTSSLDVISSQLDVLADCACCQNVITQADINTGDYTITAPGVYCLDSDVTFTSGNAITISNTAEQVILDLQGHTITASGGGVNDAILLNGATGGVTICNGAIVGGVNGIELFGSLLVFIKNLDISASTNDGIFISNGSNGVEVYDVFIHNSGVDGFFASGASLCKLINSTVVLSNVDAVHLDSCSEWTFDTVRCVGNGGYGFHIESNIAATNAISHQNCTTESCVLGGFFVTSSGLFNTFNINYLDCKVLSTGGSGFSLLQGGNIIQDIVYRTCISSNCQAHGFSTGNGISGSFVQGVLFDSCTGFQNGGSGFFIDCFGAVLKNNVAELNGGDGITLTTSAGGCQVLGSSVLGNANIGINDANVVLNNLIFSNVADANGANYSPIVPLRLFPTDITGHWINVDSTASTIGEYEQKIDAILECSCCENIITADQIIAGGYTITGSGIYCLASDVVYVSGPAITISAPIYNQIILDLGGHTITCDPISGVGPTIQVNGAGTGGSIIIRNGATSGGDGNIILNTAQSVILENLRFNFTTNGVSAISCASCDTILIDDVEIRGSAANGIEFANSTNCFVKNSLIEGSSNTGIYVTQSSNCTFENVKAFNNSYGFIVDGSNLPISPFGITYKNCIAESNNNSGFYLVNNDVGGSTISSILYQSCQSVRSGAHGFAAEANGVRSEMIINISYQDCVAAQNNVCGYFLSSPSINNGIVDVLFMENEAQGNSAAGYYINSKNIILRECLSVKNNASGILLDTLSSGCQVIESNTAQNNGYGIQDDGISNLVYSNVANENIAGNYSPSVPLQLKPTDITGYWINVDPTSSSIGEYESKIDAILSCSCCSNLITQATIDAGNITIKDPGIYCLGGNINLSGAGTPISINNSSGEVILDLCGYSITGTQAEDVIVITSSNGGVTVRNGAINNANNAVIAQYSSDIVIESLNIYNSAQYGILNINTVGLTISNIYINQTGKDGILLIGSDNTNVDTVSLSNNQNNGLHIDGVTTLTVSNVNSYFASNVGIVLEANNARLSDVVIKDCIDTGSQQGSFRIEGSSIGNYLENVLYQNCISSESPVGGFFIYSGGNSKIDNVIYQNCIFNQGKFGFYVEQISSNGIENIQYNNCTALSAFANGFYVLANDNNCNNITFKECVSNQNQAQGFYIQGGYGYTFFDCQSNFNQGDGFILVVASESQLYCSTANHNRSNGININSDNCAVKNCSASYNGNDGIVLNSSNLSQVLNSYVSNNRAVGIDDLGSNSYIHGNNATSNGSRNYNPTGLGVSISGSASYWANVRDPLFP